MYLKLNDNYALRGWKGIPYGLVDMRTGDLRVLDGEEFLLFGFFDGECVIEQLWLSARQEEALADAREKGLVTESAAVSPLRAAQRYKQSPGGYIRSVIWSITGGCNLKCRHCYMSAPRHEYADLSTAQCLDIIAQMATANVATVELSGGEPLTRPDFWQLVDALIEAGITISALHTNGLLLDDAFFAQLEARGLRFEFVLSLDGTGCHDWLRGVEGAEAAAIEAIRRLREKGHSIYVQTKFHRNNIDSLPATYELMKTLGVDRWKVSGVYNLGEWQNEGLAPLAPTVIFDSHIALIQRYLTDGKPLGLLVDEGFFAGQKDGESRIPQLRYYRDPGADGAADKGSEPSCGVCRVRPYLLPDGRLIPCIGMTGSSLERTMPRLTETPLAEIYNQSEGAFLSTVSITVDAVVARNSECQACEHRFECGGGCRADAVVGGNDLFGRSSFLCYAFKSGYRARLKAIAGV